MWKSRFWLNFSRKLKFLKNNLILWREEVTDIPLRRFNSVFDGSKLFDPPLLNGKFMWANCMAATKTSRFLLSKGWIKRFGSPRQSRGPRFRLVAYYFVFGFSKMVFKPFYFENMWLEHSSFKANILFLVEDLCPMSMGRLSFNGLVESFEMGC